jgi:hypothetical protein
MVAVRRCNVYVREVLTFETCSFVEAYVGLTHWWGVGQRRGCSTFVH